MLHRWLVRAGTPPDQRPPRFSGRLFWFGQRTEFGGDGRGLVGIDLAEGFLRLLQEGPGVGGAAGRPGAALARDAIDVVESADQTFFAGWPPQLVQALRAGPLTAR